MGLVLLEAQRLSLPVIGTNSGGIPEAIADNRSGFFVPEKNVEALAAKLRELMDYKELYDRFSNQAKKFVQEKFNPEVNIDKYIKYLKA